MEAMEAMDWQGKTQLITKTRPDATAGSISVWQTTFLTATLLVAALWCGVTLWHSAAFGADLEIVGVHRGKEAHPDKKLPTVSQACYCPQALSGSESPLHLEREHPWSLPRRSLAAQAPVGPIKVLCLRVSFPLENPDNPNTTGQGKMDFRPRADFETENGHSIDPSPHDSLYFDRQMEALNTYYSFVSRGKVQLTWDVFPPGDTMTYVAPRPMAYYGDPDSVESRLSDFFVDCMQLADSASPEIVFSDYQATIIFHAGADRQNDIGFPPTDHDLFTGFIKSGTAVSVDVNDPEPETTLTTTMFIPEQASQDSRATALNAVMAHEFGHQLGLVDLYSTRTLFTQLGDFALMDNNGFGVGIDFGFQNVFQTFGAIPVYMSAWSRAFLGFDDVTELPTGTPLAVAAAALDTANATRIVKIPISKFEYFLIENRQQAVKLSGVVGAKQDSARNVILGPARQQLAPPPGDTSVLSGEYDFLLPGNGLLIYHVDESVAFGDADGDGIPNFQDNDLQWDPSHRFVSLVEADGFVDLGGNFFKGTGGASDYWNPSTFNSFTPNTNPSTQSVTGANTHISVSVDSSSNRGHTISVSGENSQLVDSFPLWVGFNYGALSPLSYDIDTTTLGEEIITAVGDRIIITDEHGKPGWVFPTPQVKGFINFADTVTYLIGGDTDAVPATTILPINLFAQLPGAISCDPVVGVLSDTEFVAVAVGDTVYVYSFFDSNPFDGPKPDFLWKFDCADSIRQIMYNSADSSLYALTDLSLCRYDSLADLTGVSYTLPGASVGMCVINRSVVVLTGDGATSQLFYALDATTSTTALSGAFDYGPLSTDLNRDGTPDVVVASVSGELLTMAVDTATASPSIMRTSQQNLGKNITAPPTLTDLDRDGFPDIVVLSQNELTVLNRELFNLTGFPQEIDRDFRQSVTRAAGLGFDADGDGDIEIVFGAEVNDSLSGNVYALGVDKPFGFPLPGGGAPRGAPALVRDSAGASLAYVGSDGFLYRWSVNNDTSGAVWPMAGYDAAGSSYFPTGTLISPAAQSGGIEQNSVYCYPNPATGAQATLRYTLGRDAQSVAINVYDMTGELVDTYDGSGAGGLANEVSINCGRFTPGVYRVRLEVLFSGTTEKTFTDLAVVR